MYTSMKERSILVYSRSDLTSNLSTLDGCNVGAVCKTATNALFSNDSETLGFDVNYLIVNEFSLL